MYVNRAVQQKLLSHKHLVLFRDKGSGSLRGTLLVNVERRSTENVNYTLITASGNELAEDATKNFVLLF